MGAFVISLVTVLGVLYLAPFWEWRVSGDLGSVRVVAAVLLLALGVGTSTLILVSHAFPYGDNNPHGLGPVSQCKELGLISMLLVPILEVGNLVLLVLQPLRLRWKEPAPGGGCLSPLLTVAALAAGALAWGCVAAFGFFPMA